MAEPILTPWVLSLSVVYVLYIQWIGHFLLKNRSQCNYPLAFRLWTYSTVNYLMKLRDIQLPSLSTYSGDIFEPTSATLACMHAPSSSNIEHQVAVEFREACCIIIYYIVHVHKREWRHTAQQRERERERERSLHCKKEWALQSWHTESLYTM